MTYNASFVNGLNLFLTAVCGVVAVVSHYENFSLGYGYREGVFGGEQG